MSEFSLIKHYFQHLTVPQSDVVRGIGDDAAVLEIAGDQQIVVCVDTIIAGQHFLLDTPAQAIGHRALAVNLSDIAAMGAVPRWFTLALTLPEENAAWLRDFSQGLAALAANYSVQLIGGDTTQGSLSITLQLIGTIKPHQAILRSGAKVGDKIYVTGSLGDAGLGLEICRANMHNLSPERAYLSRRYQYPQPRVEVGLQLPGIANSLIDISDGLAADLQHILEESQIGAKLYVEELPLSPALCQQVSMQQAQILALTAGDDYELCFTVPSALTDRIENIAQATSVKCTCIGEIVAENGLQIIGPAGEEIHLEKLGWELF